MVDETVRYHHFGSTAVLQEAINRSGPAKLIKVVTNRVEPWGVDFKIIDPGPDAPSGTVVHADLSWLPSESVLTLYEGETAAGNIIAVLGCNNQAATYDYGGITLSGLTATYSGVADVTVVYQ